jgi:hypothetical protein
MTRNTTRTLLGTPRRAVAVVGAVILLGVAVYWLFPPLQLVGASAGVLVVGIGVLARAYPNESKQLLGRLLGLVAWAGTAVERESVRQDVEGALSAGVAQLTRGSPGAANGAVRLTFLMSGEQVEELPDGSLLIGIARHKDRARNLVAAAWLYARKGVLVDARRHLDPDVSRGIDFVVTKSLCRADFRAVSQFIQEIWLPTIEDKTRLRDLTSKLEALEEDELLAPVLFEEFAELGTRLANKFPRRDIADETAAFVEHLYLLTVRGTGERDPTHFEGRWIRCGFILVATATVVTERGADPYRKAVGWAIRNAFPRVYLISRGNFVDYARQVAASFAGDKRVLDVHEYAVSVAGIHGDAIPRLVIRMRVDVREYTSIGRQPVVAVGTAYEDRIRAAQGDKRRASTRRGRVRPS